jgi:hypothetical protein
MDRTRNLVGLLHLRPKLGVDADAMPLNESLWEAF